MCNAFTTSSRQGPTGLLSTRTSPAGEEQLAKSTSIRQYDPYSLHGVAADDLVVSVTTSRPCPPSHDNAAHPATTTLRLWSSPRALRFEMDTATVPRRCGWWLIRALVILSGGGVAGRCWWVCLCGRTWGHVVRSPRVCSACATLLVCSGTRPVGDGKGSVVMPGALWAYSSRLLRSLLERTAGSPVWLRL